MMSTLSVGNRTKMKGRMFTRKILFRYLVPLGGVAVLLLYLIRTLLNNITMRTYLSTSSSNLSTRRDVWTTPYSQQFHEHQDASKANHLIMVAGHSVIISGHLHDADTDEKDWYMFDYQVGHGLPQSIVSHIRAGIQEAAKDPHSLLVFSGGETRSSVGPINEGTSYFMVADAMDLWNEPVVRNETSFLGAATVRERSITEEFASDSFENLLFSICRFKEVAGSYPTRITVISFTFKRTRFIKLHARALQWNLNAFAYIGLDADASSGFDIEASVQGEITNAIIPFVEDPYGCFTGELQEKRKGRNPFFRTPPYELTCPEMKQILQWCGPELIPTSSLPWESSRQPF